MRGGGITSCNCGFNKMVLIGIKLSDIRGNFSQSVRIGLVLYVVWVFTLDTYVSHVREISTRLQDMYLTWLLVVEVARHVLTWYGMYISTNQVNPHPLPLGYVSHIRDVGNYSSIISPRYLSTTYVERVSLFFYYCIIMWARSGKF